MKLSIIIPVYNESATILKILARIDAAPLDLEKEIIVVDDCSTDGTRDILKSLANKYKIFYHEKNQGKGAALRRGFAAATGDILIVQDADLEYDPTEYAKIIAPIADNRADVVYGSRFLGGDAHRVLYFWHFVGNKFLTTLSNMTTNLNLTDMETCYKAFSAEAMKKILSTLQSDRFGFEPEVTAKISKNKLRVYEVGVSYAGRTYEEGKKINWKDGVAAVYAIIRFAWFG
jgi:glycosyltransferase involved in cell wall biosynthesis